MAKRVRRFFSLFVFPFHSVAKTEKMEKGRRRRGKVLVNFTFWWCSFFLLSISCSKSPPFLWHGAKCLIDIRAEHFLRRRRRRSHSFYIFFRVGRQFSPRKKKEKNILNNHGYYLVTGQGTFSLEKIEAWENVRVETGKRRRREKNTV